MNIPEMIFGIVAVIAALAAVAIMIYLGCMVAINDARREANRNIEARARRLADRMYRERLANTVIRINQRMVVVEDDLGNEKHEKIV